MANISGIEAFILRGAFTPPASETTRVNFNQITFRPLDAQADFIQYDFIDTDNNGQLQDTDTDDTKGSGGDLVRYDGNSWAVQTLGIGSIKITYDDNTSYPPPPPSGSTPTNNVRFFATRNGDLIISLLDSFKNDPNLLPVVRWETINVTNAFSNSSLGNTTMAFQDDPFPTCFVRGTVIRTANGSVAVEDLRKGDLILTHDNGLQPIRWIGSRRIMADELNQHINFRPIRITRGSLGPKTPQSDLLVSPQHRILVRSKIAQRMFGAAEVLVAAKSLLKVKGIDIAHDVSEVEYYHILFDRHELVVSNGAVTESMYPNKMALRSVATAALDEIFALFPGLRDLNVESLPAPARLLIPGRKARSFAYRHNKNDLHVLA